MSSEIPRKVFERLTDLKRFHEERDLQIFQAETRLKLIKETRKETDRRYSTIQEEIRLMDFALQSSVGKNNMLEDTLIQRIQTFKYF